MAFSFVACGVAVGIAVGLRVIDRGVNDGWGKSLGANVADGTLTAATFGILTSIGSLTKSALDEYPLWQKLLSKGLLGSVGGASFVGGQVAAQVTPNKKRC